MLGRFGRGCIWGERCSGTRGESHPGIPRLIRCLGPTVLGRLALEPGPIGAFGLAG